MFLRVGKQRYRKELEGIGRLEQIRVGIWADW
jgi:hypothetical protein